MTKKNISEITEKLTVWDMVTLEDDLGKLIREVADRASRKKRKTVTRDEIAKYIVWYLQEEYIK